MTGLKNESAREIPYQCRGAFDNNRITQTKLNLSKGHESQASNLKKRGKVKATATRSDERETRPVRDKRERRKQE